MVFSTTPIYALAVALIWLILWFRVSAMRGALGQSIGDGGNPALLLRIRQHGNCHDWATFLVIGMILAEGAGAPALHLHVIGLLLVLGRIAHPFGLKADRADHPLRYVGNGSNLLAALGVMGSLGAAISGL